MHIFFNRINTTYDVIGKITGVAAPIWINGFYGILSITWDISILFMIQARRENVPEEAFMVAELETGALQGISGLIRYDQAFANV